VLLITARADLGGGPRHVLDLIRAFTPSEAEFSMAAPDQDPFAPQFRELCRDFLEIPARQFSFSAFWRLHRFIRSSQVDLIHSHGRGAGLYSRLLGLTTRHPVLHTFHGVHSAPGMGGRIKLLIDQALALLPFHGIFASPAELDRARTHRVIRGQAFSIIPNAVDLSRFPNEPRQRTGPLQRVGAFLRDDPAKGPDLWLKLVRSAQQDANLSGVTFTCAGITRDDLSKHGEIPEGLEIMGPLKDPVEWLLNLDAFVSTSRSEGLPLGVLEAMAAGVPCLLSDIPAHQMFFDRGVAVGFDASDSSHFSSSLGILLSKKYAVLQVEAAHQWVKREFSLLSFKKRLASTFKLYPAPN
jgi:glycosyltransferase involved in cell wall biosynthesis